MCALAHIAPTEPNAVCASCCTWIFAPNGQVLSVKVCFTACLLPWALNGQIQPGKLQNGRCTGPHQWGTVRHPKALYRPPWWLIWRSCAVRPSQLHSSALPAALPVPVGSNRIEHFIGDTGRELAAQNAALFCCVCSAAHNS